MSFCWAARHWVTHLNSLIYSKHNGEDVVAWPAIGLNMHVAPAEGGGGIPEEGEDTVWNEMLERVTRRAGVWSTVDTAETAYFEDNASQTSYDVPSDLDMWACLLRL